MSFIRVVDEEKNLASINGKVVDLTPYGGFSYTTINADNGLPITPTPYNIVEAVDRYLGKRQRKPWSRVKASWEAFWK